MKYIEKIFDVSTGETTMVERDMTSEEQTAYNNAINEANAIMAEAAAKAAAKAALLEQLGITEEQAKLLLS